MSESWPDEMTVRIAAAIKNLRGDRSGQWLSDRTEELGHRVSRSTISEIETGRRKSITVADLIILAAALDTVPIALIYPGPYDQNVRALPNLEVPQIWAARWFSAQLRTISEVPFDDKGHYVQVPNPQKYADNIQTLVNAGAAADLFDRKAAMVRERNRLAQRLLDGEDIGTEEQIRSYGKDIASIQSEIDYYLLLSTAEQSHNPSVFEKLLGLAPGGESKGQNDGR